MFKNLLILLLSTFLLFSCSKKNKETIVSEPTDEEKAVTIYAEAVDALNEGNAYYAANKFKDVESLMPQSKWVSKSSLMASYADYTRKVILEAKIIQDVLLMVKLNFTPPNLRIILETSALPAPLKYLSVTLIFKEEILYLEIFGFIFVVH